MTHLNNPTTKKQQQWRGGGATKKSLSLFKCGPVYFIIIFFPSLFGCINQKKKYSLFMFFFCKKSWCLTYHRWKCILLLPLSFAFTHHNHRKIYLVTHTHTQYALYITALKMRGCLCDPRVQTCVIIAITHTHTHTIFCCCTEERFYSPVHLIHCCMVLKLFTQYSSLYVLTTRMCGNW